MATKVLLRRDDEPQDSANYFVFSGNALTWAWDWNVLSPMIDAGIIKAEVIAVSWQTIQHYISHCWTGGPVPPGYEAPS